MQVPLELWWEALCIVVPVGSSLSQIPRGSCLVVGDFSLVMCRLHSSCGRVQVSYCDRDSMLVLVFMGISIPQLKKSAPTTTREESENHNRGAGKRKIAVSLTPLQLEWIVP